MVNFLLFLKLTEKKIEIRWHKAKGADEVMITTGGDVGGGRIREWAGEGWGWEGGDPGPLRQTKQVASAAELKYGTDNHIVFEFRWKSFC